MCFKKAFTMLEIVFVIVIIGILASIAVPRLAATRTDAVITKGKTQVSAIRSGIAVEKGLRLLRGETPVYPPSLDDCTNYGVAGEELFDDNILENPIISGTTDGHWEKTTATTYTFNVTPTDSVVFTYSSSDGKFTCVSSVKYCTELTR